MPNYFPLHVHSHYSLLDGLSKPKQIAKRTIEIDSPGCCLTDHGSLSGAISFLKAMKDEKVNKKPILGCELYVCNDLATNQDKENGKLTHLPVLAKNDAGWKDLVHITSASNDPSRFYKKPRLSLKELKNHTSGNIIAFSGHLGSHVATAIYDYENDRVKGDAIKQATAVALELQDVFGKGNFYLEVQLMDHRNTPAQKRVTEVIRELSKQLKIPLVATPDAHYADKEQATDQRVLLCTNLRVTMKQAQDPKFGMGCFFQSSNFHIPSYDEMIEYGHTEEELANTLELASKCEEYQNILRNPILPEFKCPEGRTPDEWMRELCRRGWAQRIQNRIPKNAESTYVDRIKYELETLQGAGLSSYFLIVEDIVRYGRDRGWLMGPGRGSAAGCLASYLMYITGIDPLPYNLLFERFYNAGRNTATYTSFPDIDIDVPTNKREEIINYIRNKYGHDNVSQIVTFQTMKGRGALKDVFRAYGGVSFDEMNRITMHIPDEAKIADELQEMREETGESSIIRWALENRESKLKEWCYIDDDGNLQGPLAKRFEQAIRLEGTKAAQSRHAAGVVISPVPLHDICPMVITKDKDLIAGWEMEDLEAGGLPKFDVLGVAFLDKVMGVNKILETGDI